MYVNHVKQIYGTAVLVFDGYNNEPSTKDAIHLIRKRTCSGVTVHFTGDMLIQSKKDEFVATKENKACVGQCQAGCRCADSANNCCICPNQTYYLSG